MLGDAGDRRQPGIDRLHQQGPVARTEAAEPAPDERPVRDRPVVGAIGTGRGTATHQTAFDRLFGGEGGEVVEVQRSVEAGQGAAHQQRPALPDLGKEMVGCQCPKGHESRRHDRRFESAAPMRSADTRGNGKRGVAHQQNERRSGAVVPTPPTVSFERSRSVGRPDRAAVGGGLKRRGGRTPCGEPAPGRG